MIPHMHDDKTQSEEQILSPVENKQMATPLEKRSKPTPAPPKRWIGVLLTILGIFLALAGGFLSAWPWMNMGVSETIGLINILLFVGIALSVVVGAALLRSWWALLIVPIAFVAGAILAGYILDPLIYGWNCVSVEELHFICPPLALNSYVPGWSAVQAKFESFWIDMSTWLPIMIWPLLIGTALGAWLGVSLNKGWKKRRQQR